MATFDYSTYASQTPAYDPNAPQPYNPSQPSLHASTSYDPANFQYNPASPPNGFDLHNFSSHENSPQAFSPASSASLAGPSNAWPDIQNILSGTPGFGFPAANGLGAGGGLSGMDLQQQAFLASFSAGPPVGGSVGPQSASIGANARFHPYGISRNNSAASGGSLGGVSSPPPSVAYPNSFLTNSAAHSPAPVRPHPLVDAPSPRNLPPTTTPGLSPHPLQNSDPSTVSPYPDPTAAPAPPAPGSTAEKMQHLFRFLDNSGWTVGDMLYALSSPPPGGGEHRKRLDDFLGDRERAGMGEEEAHGPETIMRLWIEGTPTAVSVAAAEAAHASTTPSASAPGTPHGMTPGAASDIAMSDTASLGEVGTQVSFTGRIVIPPTQADILGKWLMKPGRPNLAAEKQSIKPEHMRIYSSLAPLELHTRGAELCRVILIRDRELKAEFADRVNTLDDLAEGPKLTPSNACDFASYSDYDLWHHSVMTFLQLSTRYPAFGKSQPAVLDIMPSTAPVPSLDTETPSFSHATHSHLDLHSHLLERALRVHWEDFRTALAERGGLLRSAVKAFPTHKKAATPVRLLAICDDVATVGRALAKSVSGMDRILPYDPLISPARNSWRQRAFWSDDPTQIWSLSTIHFLEISVMFPRFVEGVRELPTLQGLLAGSSSSFLADA